MIQMEVNSNRETRTEQLGEAEKGIVVFAGRILTGATLVYNAVCLQLCDCCSLSWLQHKPCDVIRCVDLFNSVLSMIPALFYRTTDFMSGRMLTTYIVKTTQKQNCPSWPLKHLKAEGFQTWQMCLVSPLLVLMITDGHSN